jgi:hypothetical protein
LLTFIRRLCKTNEMKDHFILVKLRRSDDVATENTHLEFRRKLTNKHLEFRRKLTIVEGMLLGKA